jgi:hypothetical protein
MDRPDQVGPRLDKRIERGPLRDATREEQRAHGTVEQQWRTCQALGEDAARV